MDPDAPRRRRPVHVTLVLRPAGRRFADERAWQSAVAALCSPSRDCSWSSMHVANLTFCQQVTTETEKKKKTLIDRIGSDRSAAR
jgi:hypothetical protein